MKRALIAITLFSLSLHGPRKCVGIERFCRRVE